jgi:hypothetical protein
MKKKQKDRLLDIPAEANRDKHVNFVAQERGEADPSASPDTNTLMKNKDDKQDDKSKKRHRGRK